MAEKTPRRHISFRLPPDVLVALDKAAARTFVSKTKLVELVLRKGLPTFTLADVITKDDIGSSIC